MHRVGRFARALRERVNDIIFVYETMTLSTDNDFVYRQ